MMDLTNDELERQLCEAEEAEDDARGSCDEAEQRADELRQELERRRRESSEPHQKHGRYRVHWSAHLRDSGPTDRLRALGHTVTVYSDERHHSGARTQIDLNPTALPIPMDPWGEIMLAVGWAPGKLKIGGVAGQRYITNGYAAIVIPDGAYDQARSLIPTLGAAFSSICATGDPSTGTYELATTATLTDAANYCTIGPAAVDVKYVAMFLRLGVRHVETHGETGPVVAPGVAAVMPMRLGSEA